MDIEKVFNEILLSDYNNDENVGKFIKQITPIINEHIKNYAKLIDSLEDYVQALEYELNNVKHCEHAYCKYDDLKEELEKILYNIK